MGISNQLKYLEVIIFQLQFKVSNRLPFVLCRRKQKAVSPLDEDEQNNASVDVKEQLYRKPSAGGLVTAVAPVMVQSGGST